MKTVHLIQRVVEQTLKKQSKHLLFKEYKILLQDVLSIKTKLEK